MKTVVITGGTSMIGVELVEECIQNGCNVIVLNRAGSKNLRRLPISEKLTILDCALDQLKDFKAERIGMADVFYHLAWSNTDKRGRLDPELQFPNIQYTLDALDLAHRLGCKKFIGAGSQAEYGIHVDDKTGPNSPVTPQIAYGICKYAAGKLGEIHAAQLGLHYIWVRVFSVYGPNDMPGTMLRDAIEKMSRGEHCAFTEGVQLWDYLYSSDAGRAFYLIGEKAKGRRVYCLGSGEAMPIREYIKELRDIVAPDAEIGLGEIPYSKGGPMKVCANIDELICDTGWKPRVPFSDGIRKMIEAMRG